MKAKYLLTLALLFTLVGCSQQSNSLQDQVESLTGETQEVLAESERFEEFEYTMGVLDDVKFFSYEENVVVMSSYCHEYTTFTNEEDIKLGYDVSSSLITYDYNRTILDGHKFQDVKLIMEVRTLQDEVIGYYDGEVWEGAK